MAVECLSPAAAVDSPEGPVLPPAAAVDSPEHPVLPPAAAVDFPERPVLPHAAAVDSPELPVVPPAAAVDSPERPVQPAPPAAIDLPVHPAAPTVTPSPRTTKKLALYDTFMRNIKGMKKSARCQLLTKITMVEEVKQVRGASLLDTVTIKKKKHQKIQLTEFLYVLHMQYNNAAGPEHRVGFSYFCGPVLPNNTNVCLCMRHQNISLRMKPLHGLGLPALPDMFICDVTIENFHAATGLPPVVTYLQWRCVDVPYGQGLSTVINL